MVFPNTGQSLPFLQDSKENNVGNKSKNKNFHNNGHGQREKIQRGWNSLSGNNSTNQRDKGTPDKITAPYNFIPYSNTVIFPEWSKNVSHDIPFSDGISGSMQFKMTAKTPIYIRNGGDWEDTNKDDENYKSFFKVNNQYMIPATSLKGMLRNIVEIISFSKLKTTDKIFSVRDLHANFYLQAVNNKNVNAGWLRYDAENDVYQLFKTELYELDHLELYRIGAKDIGTKDTALDKYNYMEDLELRLDQKIKAKTVTEEKGLTKRKAEFDESGSIEGHIVFTGQPTHNRITISNGKAQNSFKKKHTEFVFGIIKDFSTQKCITITKKQYQVFDDIHTTTTQRTDKTWDSYYKPKLRKGEAIPVFYTLENDNLAAMGLARLFRLSYKKSPAECLPQEHKRSNLDFAQTLFGTLEDDSSDKQRALKGRVFLTPAIAEETPTKKGTINTILGGPKPTFYPSYIQQGYTKDANGKFIISNEYKTYMNKDAKIRGFKTYPLQDGPHPTSPDDKQKNVATKFIPLAAGSSFSFTLHYHNVKPQELGSLLWALTLGGLSQNDADSFHHSLGMGKPYGFGQVHIELFDFTPIKDYSGREYSPEDLLLSFETYVKNKIGHQSQFTDNITIKEFLASRYNHKNEDFTNNFQKYMALEEFAKSKGSKTNRDKRLVLPSYTELLASKKIDFLHKISSIRSGKNADQFISPGHSKPPATP